LIMAEHLVLVELVGGEIDDSAWELAQAARAAGAEKVSAALLGKDVTAHAENLTKAFDAVHVFDDAQLEVLDGEVSAALLTPFVERIAPTVMFIPHTNYGMDLAPGLAAKSGRPLLTDLIAIESIEGGIQAVRTMYGGKVHARVKAVQSEKGYVLTLRPGSFPSATDAAVGGAVITEEVPAGLAPGRRFVETITPEAGDVDITQAEILVAVGRGIEEEENLEIITSLAEALGAEVACSRPVVDKKWLPKGRQVGTSGLSVKPKIYIAVGISGSFQHMGGVKGGPFIVAINKDPAAPIFGVADVGIVGDLFDIVPLLEEQITEAKG
jgi:electron transfer flavoprotein alpha subunit